VALKDIFVMSPDDPLGEEATIPAVVKNFLLKPI
jgi:hypothetical protein